jgi:hypothetical protein
MQIISLLELTAKRGRKQHCNRGFARAGNTHDNGDDRLGDGVREGCGPFALGRAVIFHHTSFPARRRY